MQEVFQQAVEQLLIWIGFGTLVGLLAKAIFPGKDPGGAISTVVIGIIGSIIGAGTLLFFSENLRVTPISPVGFVVAIAGTSLLLFCYRVLNGTMFKEGFRMAGAKKPRRKVTVTESET